MDVLSPLRRLSLAFQQERDDPVKLGRHIQEFTWSMAKLKLLMSPDINLTNLNHLFKNKNCDFYYQNIKLTRFRASKDSVNEHRDRHDQRILEILV